MPLLVKQNGNRKSADRIIVKVSGWVKLRKDGDTYHYPPTEVKRIAEPDTEAGDSEVVYQSPHGRV